MNKFLAYVAAFAVAVGLIFFTAWRGAREEQARLRKEIAAVSAQRSELVDRLARRQAVSQSRATAISKAQADKAQADSEAHHALQDNPDWAAGRVPDSVYNTLPGRRTAP